MIEPLPPLTAPTIEQLRDTDRLQRNPGLLDACILLTEHGINVYEIPDNRPDTFTEAGYLTVLGIDREHARMVYSRQPWPAGLTVQQITAALDEEHLDA